MRILNSLKNSFYGVVSQLIIILLGFYSRRIFTMYLGPEYLGLNGLFTNVISILSLTELGFGTAALYALYKPLADNNKAKISALMSLYARIYHIMFFIILILGLVLIPIIPYLIKDMPDIEGIYFIYYLFVLNSAITYLFAYKRSLLFADQRNYIIIKVTTISKILLTLLQIGILQITGNYYLYIISMIIFGFLENFILSHIVDRDYSYLQEMKNEKIDQATKHELFVNTKALLMHKIGSIAVFQTDNIITSAFVGITTVGLYSNYTLLINPLHTLIGNIVDGAKASIGNYNSNETDENKYKMFLKLNFVIHILYSVSSVGLLCLSNIFIAKIWLKNEDFLFSMNIVFLITFYFYLRGMRYAYSVVKETSGVFNPDRYKAVFEAIMNIGSSIILVHFFGFAGVLMGTILTTLSVPFVIEVYVTFKYVFHMKSWIYYKVFSKNLITTGISMLISYFLCMLLTSFPAILQFIIGGIICVVITLSVNIIAYHKSEEFLYFYQLIQSFINTIKNKLTGGSNAKI